MASLSWRVGAFAERFPVEARELGRYHKLEAVANGMLFESAGAVRAGAIGDAAHGCLSTPYPCDGQPPGCCGALRCSSFGDSCCDRSTCTRCGPHEEEFAAIHPEAAAQLDAAHAHAAAVRDILTDPDVEDIVAALEEASRLTKAGKLAKAYAPQTPAKKLPSGADAPARCPVCGAAVCPTCGCSCACVSSAHTKPSPAPAGE